MKIKIPGYSFFRILIVSMVLYFLLITPTTTYMVVKNFPMYFGKSHGSMVVKDTTIINIRTDSLTKTFALGTINNDIKIEGNGNKSVSMNFDRVKDGVSALISYLIGFILMIVIIGINIPFKFFLKRRRKNLEISPKLAAYCRKYLFRMPYFNSGALLFVLLLRNMNNVFNNSTSLSKTEHDLGINMMIISIISSLLVALFTFFWQQHSIHFRNLEYFFDKNDLYKRQKKLSFLKMRGKFILVQGITTLLPVSIIVFYIFMSMSKPADFGITKVSEEQAKIFFGGYSSIMHDVFNDEATLNDIASGYYINTVDMFFSSIGIIAGVIVTLIYVIFFVRWITFQITSPVKNLLKKMEEATATKEYSFSLVRSNDEMGQLTEGYNVMAKKIMSYIREVEAINLGLEAKVKERTVEIEAQRDEIEAQRDEIEAQRDIVTKQKDKLEEIHKAVTDSINYAKRIQQAKLPKKVEIYLSLPNSFILFKPKDIVSGDFYFFRKKNQNVFIAAVDCTGHGVPGAFMSMIGSERLNDAVSQSSETSEVLKILNKGIKTSLQQSDSKESTRDGLDIAICSVDLENKIVKYAGANRPIWIIRKGHTTVEEIKATKTAIGGLTDDNQYFDTHEIKLNKDDTFYIFSDGYADTFNTKNKKLTTKNFKQILLDIQNKTLQEQEKYLDEFIENWKLGTELVDDILVIGVRL